MGDPKRVHNPLDVFVDADAFVAFARQDDTHHPRALRLLHRAALSYIDEMQSAESPMFVHWIDAVYRKNGFTLVQDIVFE